jgi:hypothetical protein
MRMLLLAGVAGWSAVTQLILVLAMLIYVWRAPPEASGVIVGGVAIAIGELANGNTVLAHGYDACQVGDGCIDSCP